MGILRADRVAGLGGANAINGSVFFGNGLMGTAYDSIKTEPSSDFIMGTGDFTLEGWFYLGNVTQNWQALIADTLYGGTGGWTFYVNTNQLNFWKGGASVVSGGTLTANTWYHLAFSRASGSNRLFVDGSVVATASDSTNYTRNELSVAANNVDVGGAIGAAGLDGYASNVRITKGTALYTAAFTPPTTRLEKRSDTVLLCCQSPGNVEKEETGKIIIARGKARASHFAPDKGEDYGTTFADNTKFDTLSYMVLPGGTTAERGRGRGLVGGGFTPGVSDQIYSVEIASDGTSSDFGNLSMSRRGTAAVSSSTRAVWAGGYAPGYQDRIDYVNISAGGKAIDFGNLDTGRFESSGVSNGTRGVYGPSENPGAAQNVIQYITIASAGNATDFGDSSIATGTKKQASMNSTTRGVFAGGQNVPSPSAFYDIIDYITIASTGNATDFGDLTENVFMCTGVSDATRGVRGGGNTSPTGSNTNTIDYITIASAGNATNFGDLITANQRSGGMSNSIRGLFSGGATPNSNTFVSDIAKIIIQTTGNATDFGDYIGTKASQGAGCSDSHGGIS